MKTIYLGGGCFWGVEKYFKQCIGVVNTEVGYAQSEIENITYEQVCSKKFGAVEVVKIDYDDMSLEKILELLFRIIDPTLLNRQGNDKGINYRTGVYYIDSTDKTIVDEFIITQQCNYIAPIVVEVQKLENFYSAEEYHQDYLDKNPNGYCHIDMFKLKYKEKKQ